MQSLKRYVNMLNQYPFGCDLSSFGRKETRQFAFETRTGGTRVPQMKRLCDASAISEAQLSRFSFENLDIVVSRYEGKLIALEDRCGHMGAPVSMGKLEMGKPEGCALVCPLHDAAFDIQTGKIVREARLPSPPAGQEVNPRMRMFSMVRTFPLKSFPIAERDGGVFVELPDDTRG